MHDDASVGKTRREKSCSSRVIEMDMREEDEIHIFARDAELIQRRQERRDGACDAGVDKRRASVINDQMTGIEQRANVAGVDRVNAGLECLNRRHRSAAAHSRHSATSAAMSAGPRKIPTSPNDSTPPRIPSSTQRNGRRAPPPMMYGRTKWSAMKSTTVPITATTMPAAKDPAAAKNQRHGTEDHRRRKGNHRRDRGQRAEQYRVRRMRQL